MPKFTVKISGYKEFLFPGVEAVDANSAINQAMAFFDDEEFDKMYSDPLCAASALEEDNPDRMVT
jgi:hypothetical protein